MPRHWIFLRGLSRDARHWAGLPERFAERMSVSVSCIDLPGNGTRVGERSPATIAGLMEACRERCSASPPFGFVALSLGAMVAVEWARRHPGEVRACVLMNTSARGGPWYRRLRPEHYRALAIASMSNDPHRRERAILQATSRAYAPDSPEGRELLARWVAWYREAPVTHGNTLRQLLAASRFAPPAHMSPATLLLASQRDALVDVRCSEALANHWNCALEVHPQAGHDLALDAPDWVVERVVAWQPVG